MVSHLISTGQVHSSRLSKNVDYYRHSWSLSVNRLLWDRYTVQDSIKAPIILVICCLYHTTPCLGRSDFK